MEIIMIHFLIIKKIIIENIINTQLYDFLKKNK